MRAVCVEGLPRRSVGALLGTVLALVAGCSKFSGPYMCADGYASCVNPSQNVCETDTTTDGLNCGDCGMTCAVGAPCLGSSCGAAAVRIGPSGSSALVRTNASAVFWSGSILSATVYSLPLSAAAGAAPAAVITDGVGLGEGHTPFAVDDANLYYLALVPGATGGCPSASGGCINLVQMAMGGARTTLVPWTALSALLSDAGIPVGNGAGGNIRASLAVNASHVFLLFSLQSGSAISYALADAQIGGAGQNGELLAKATSTNGFGSNELAVNSTSAIFETWENNNPYLRVVRVADKQMSTLSSNGGPYGGGIGPLAADESSVYTFSSGCPCNNDNHSYTGPPPGVVTRIPLDGSAPQTLAKFWGMSGGIDVDSTHVYWSTDTAAWKVPLAGGMPAAVAGNLSHGVAAYQCMGGCNGGSSQSGPTSIAIASSAVYVAATGTEQAILKVAR